jgi:protocatechuate 4,5-dioxygenase beta chain
VSAIVGGFIMSHDPLVFINPRKKDPGSVLEAYAEIRRRVAELRATSAIIIGADHYILFGPKCLPQLLIGLGEINGPVDQLPGVPNKAIPHNPELAKHIFSYSQEAGLDLAVSKGLAVDHAVGVPAQLCLPEDGSVKTVPVYMASGVEPYIRLQRAHQFGAMLRAAVEAQDSDERVVIFGSGGISHWVGTGEMGKIDQDFDRFVLDAIASGDARSLLTLSDRETMLRGGNGALEIRHYLAVMGALPGAQGEVLAYHPWDGGVTGLGFAQIHAASRSADEPVFQRATVEA